MSQAQAIAAPSAGHLRADGQVNWMKVFLGFGGMVVGQFMAVLDIQIVTASLSQIQAGIGASADEISWVQTIYLLAEVIIIPLTAYLTKMWGTRIFYVTAAGLFIAASVATGLSTSIESMIFTRALQGLAGGAMIPAVFATAMTVFPIERRITANVIVGLIVTLAPTVGPTLGGHITEWLNWRWLFFINIPPGLLVMFLVSRYGDFDKGDPAFAKGIDWWGLGLMTVFLLSFQYVLEEGAGDGWYKDDGILWLGVMSLVIGVLFIWRQLTYWQPIVSLKPFVDRNFTVGMIMTFVSGISLYGGTFILPLFLAQVLRYSAAEVGTTMLVSGLTMFLIAPVGGNLVRRLDARFAMVVGFSLAAFGIGLGAQINQNWSFRDFALLQILRGVGVMIAMIASQQLTVSTLPVSMMKDASGLVNLMRNVGGAVGLAMISTILGLSSAGHYVDLGGALSQGSQASQEMMDGFVEMMRQGGSPDPEGAARKAFAGMLRREGLIMAFADGFVFLAAGCGLAAFVALFAKPVSAAPPIPSGGH